MKKTIGSAMLVFGAFVAAVTVAQVSPQTLPSNTVWGRLGISAGPGQAIPFSILSSQLTTATPPGGSTTQVQYNNAGAFGGISGVTSNGTSVSFTAGNFKPSLTSNAFVTGGGASTAPNAVTITGLVQGNGASAPAAYAGTSCTNQFPRSLDLNGAATCASIAIASDVSGLASGIATFLATPSSANLASAVSNETGSGALVFGTSPTFTTDLTSPLIIGGTGAGSTLTFKSTSGVGSSDAMIFQVGSNGAKEGFRIATGGQIIQGHTASTSGSSVQINSTGSVTNTIAQQQWSNDATGSTIYLLKSRGTTPGSQATLNNADTIGDVRFIGSDGTAAWGVASVLAAVDAAPSSSKVPGRLVFSTSLASSGTVTERMRISNTGHTIFNGTAPALTSCGTTPAITGNDVHGTVTMGTAAPTGCVITFNLAYATAPTCVVTWRATPLASQSYAISTSAITLTQTATSSNVVDFHCFGT